MFRQGVDHSLASRLPNATAWAHPIDADAAVTVTEDDEGVPSIQSLLYAAASDLTIERVRAWVSR